MQEVSRKSCRVKEVMLFPQKVSVFVGKCVYSRYFQGSLYFPPRKRFDNVTAGLHEVLGWQQVLTGREEMETFSSHHYFNLYLSTSLSTCSSPCRLTLARCSLMLRIFLRRIRFIFTYFLFFSSVRVVWVCFLPLLQFQQHLSKRSSP